MHIIFKTHKFELLWNWFRYDNGGISIFCLVQFESGASDERGADIRLWFGSFVSANAYAWDYSWCYSQCCFPFLAYYCPHYHSLHRFPSFSFVSESVLRERTLFCFIHWFCFCIGTSSRSFFRGIQMWRVETILKVKISWLERMNMYCYNESIIVNSSFLVILQNETAKQADLVNSNGDYETGIQIFKITCHALLLIWMERY